MRSAYLFICLLMLCACGPSEPPQQYPVKGYVTLWDISINRDQVTDFKDVTVRSSDGSSTQLTTDDGAYDLGSFSDLKTEIHFEKDGYGHKVITVEQLQKVSQPVILWPLTGARAEILEPYFEDSIGVRTKRVGVVVHDGDTVDHGSLVLDTSVHRILRVPVKVTSVNDPDPYFSRIKLFVGSSDAIDPLRPASFIHVEDMYSGRWLRTDTTVIISLYEGHLDWFRTFDIASGERVYLRTYADRYRSLGNHLEATVSYPDPKSNKAIFSVYFQAGMPVESFVMP